MGQEQGEDDFKLTAISSARRSGSRSRTAQISGDDDEEEEEEEGVGKRRGVARKRRIQPVQRMLQISDSDEN